MLVAISIEIVVKAALAGEAIELIVEEALYILKKKKKIPAEGFELFVKDIHWHAAIPIQIVVKEVPAAIYIEIVVKAALPGEANELIVKEALYILKKKIPAEAFELIGCATPF